MAIKKFNKIEIIGLRSIQNDIMRTLLDIGAIHLIEKETEGLVYKNNEYDDILEKLNKIYEGLKEFEPKRSPLEGEKILIKYSRLGKIMGLDEISRLYNEISTFLSNEKEKYIEINTLKHHIENLMPFIDIKYPVLDIQNSANTLVRVFTLGSKQEEFFEQLKMLDDHYSEKTGIYEMKEVILLIYHAAIKKEIEEILLRSEIEYIDIKNLKGIPSEEIKDSEIQIKKLQDAIEKEKNTLEKYKDRIEDIKLALDHYQNERDKNEILSRLPGSNKTFYICGWVPEKDNAKIEEILKTKFSDSIYIQFSVPNKEDVIPVDYRNPAIIDHYESITDMYSKPNYKEIDPTPYIAIFFTFFFGFCLTDAGYGLVITVLTAFLIFNKKVKKMLGAGIKTFYVFFFSGISALIMGLITGSFFGIALPQFLKEMVPLDLSIDNLGNTAIPFLKLSIYVGAFQIGVGYLISMFNQIKRGNAVMGILQNFPNVIIIISGIKLVSFLIGAKGNTGFWTALFLLAVLCNVLFSAAESKGIKRILKGGYNAFFGITGILGDILSYMRLFALGLATGILIFVINTVAGVLVELLGIPGYFLAFILLVIGHSVNLALNILGAFVHSLRLQFVEFFQKFFEGGGMPYEPMKNNYRFIVLDDNK